MHSAPHRVLVLDDSVLVLELLRAALEARGLTVDTATTLDDLERLRTAAAPDLIVLDVQMPEAWGDDVAALLRSVYAVPAPILLFSTLDAEELEGRATAAGADSWISKQAGLERVTAKILSMLEAKAERS